MVRRGPGQVPDRGRCPEQDPRPGVRLSRLVRGRVEGGRPAADPRGRETPPGRSAGVGPGAPECRFQPARVFRLPWGEGEGEGCTFLEIKCKERAAEISTEQNSSLSSLRGLGLSVSEQRRGSPSCCKRRAA